MKDKNPDPKKFITSKIDGKTYSIVNGAFTRHLRDDHNITFQEYWETYELGVSPKCPYCDETRKFVKSTRSHSKTCGALKCKTEAGKKTVDAKNSQYVLGEKLDKFLDQKDNLYELYHSQDKTIDEIARVYNTRAASISKLLDYFDLKNKPKISKLRYDNDADDIISLYSNNTPISHIATKYKTSDGAIRAVLEKNDVFIAPNKSYKKASEDYISKADLYTDYIILQLSNTQISKKRSININTIKKILVHYELYIPNRTLPKKIKKVKSKVKTGNAKYIFSKIDNIEYCVTNGEFSRHLNYNSTNLQEYWETYELDYIPICPHCAKKARFKKGPKTYTRTCGSHVCYGKEIKDIKANWTDKQKENDSKNKKIAAENIPEADRKKSLEKRKKTTKARYGVEHSGQSTDQKTKSKKTKLERYGNEYYNNSEKSAEANRSKTPQEQDVINDKRRETNLELFGVECPFMQPDVLTKSRKANASGKKYEMPSGKTVHIRGHENIALDEILSTTGEDDIYIDDIRSSDNKMIFEYVSDAHRKAKYYPDIFIKSQNKFIEVKSWWWYNGNGADKYASRLSTNIKKMQSVMDRGYDFEFWVYDNKGTKTVIKSESTKLNVHKKIFR